METPSSANLMNAARAFMGKSVIMAIAPLALSTSVNAAVTVFSLPGSSDGGNANGFISGGGYYMESSYFSEQLTLSNNILGISQSLSAQLNPGFGDGSFTINLGSGTISGDVLGAGVSIPIEYAFSLETTDPNVVLSWTLDYGFGSTSTTPANASGAGTGSFTDSLNLVTGADTTTFNPVLTINVTNSNTGQPIVLDITKLSYNAVPEPSTPMLLLGAAMLVTTRRKRTCAA